MMGSKAKFKVQLTKPMRYTWVEKIPWRRAWLPTPVFLPGEPHRQRSLVGYIPRGPKESDTTERRSTAHTHILHVELSSGESRRCKMASPRLPGSRLPSWELQKDAFSLC